MAVKYRKMLLLFYNKKRQKKSVSKEKRKKLQNFVLEPLDFHPSAVIDHARRKANHHPIEPDEKDDHERERAIEFFLISKFKVDEKDAGGNQPGEGGDQASDQNVVDFTAIGTDVQIQDPSGEKADCKDEGIDDKIEQPAREFFHEQADPDNERAGGKEKHEDEERQ